MPRRFSVNASPYVLLTLTAFLWSLNWVIGRAMVGHVSPVTLTFIRWSVAVAVILPFAWSELRAHWTVIRREWKVVAWLGFWGTGLHNLFGYVGMQYTTATNGVMLNSCIPIMIVLLAWVIYRETITRMQAFGVAVSLAGVLAILSRGDAQALASLTLNKGDLIILGGIVFWAAYTVFLRMKPADLGGLALLAACSVVGVAILAPMAALELALLGGHVEFTPGTLAAMAYVGIFPSFVGYVFWNRAVHEVGPNIAGIFVHLMPAFGSLLAWMFLGERIYPFHIVGIALILTGIALTTTGRRVVPEAGPE